MSRPVIEINNLGKQYRLGQVGRSSIADDLKRFYYNIQGKEDPFLKVGEQNDRTQKGNSNYVWALKDINLTVNQGDVLGIVGKNGAGKSTLLKILSRTTSPTTGDYKVKGRIASLLEVGTGFHPDLTGRENIFLNGAILGMKRNEIAKQFDAIVDFSGVERYIDTPVKRYSSGMYVRLAFAVAAHLEPEILIIDEVLAVGDQEFQNKCLGKMKDVSGQGRTVLFVSHNMSAIKKLCNKGALLHNGTLVLEGNMNDVINAYGSNMANNSSNLLQIKKRNGIGEILLSKIEISTENSNRILAGHSITFTLSYIAKNIDKNANYEFAIGIWNTIGAPMFMLSNLYKNEIIKISKETGTISFTIAKLNLQIGKYTLNFLISKNGIDLDHLADAYSFEVTENDFYDSGNSYPLDYDGFYQTFSISQS